MNKAATAPQLVNLCVECKRHAPGSMKCTRSAERFTEHQLFDNGHELGKAVLCVRCCDHNHG